jgi:NADP-dependent 3-hydroxy acid dehydrogenase YdfG
MHTDFHGHVTVITGASSGIGRATSLELTRRGATVLAVARNGRALDTLATEANPGRIATRVADVTDPGAMDAVAAVATSQFGRIDTWVNAAAVAMYSTVDRTEPDELRRILDVNVVGTANGIRAALPIMERQGHGTIVNLGSVESRRALPYQSAYAASKYAVKGLTDALRAELALCDSPVSLVLVMPSAINTPFFRHARSKLGVQPKPFPPIYEPEAVAETIARVALHPVPEVIVGGGGKGIDLLDRISPRLADALLGQRLVGLGQQVTDRPDDGRDNLDAPLDETGSVHGEWGDQARRRSWYTSTLGLHPVGTRLAAIAAAGAFLFARRVRR